MYVEIVKKMYFKFVRMKKKMNHPIVTLLKIQIRPTLKATLNEKEEKPKKGINIDQQKDVGIDEN